VEASWRSARGLFAALLAPPALWLALLFFAPIAIIAGYSFGENVGLTEIEVSGTFANYARALDPLYIGIFGKSLWFAGLTTAICLVVGMPVAFAIAFAPERAKLWLLMAIMLPFWTNLLVRTYALIALMRDSGYINKSLGVFGIDPLPLLHNNFAVVVGLVYVHLPFMVLPLYAALDRLDRSLLEASLDLGASHLGTFFRVVVPLALPGIMSGIVITFIPALGAYLTPDLMGGPDSQMIANVIERQFKRANDWPFGAALSLLLLYLTFAAIALQSLWGRRK
jgi:spermidine/putrescine transport system permease protein